MLHGLAGGDQPGKVKDRIESRRGRKHRGRVVHLRLNEFGPGRHLCRVVTREIVEYRDRVPFVEQQSRHDTADVTGAAGDQKLHASELSFPQTRTQPNTIERHYHSHVALPKQRLARGIVRAADGLTRWTTRMLGADPTSGREEISDAELGKLVAANTTLDPEERLIIGKALEEAREAGHTRFPVCDITDDDVVGFVHLRDLLWAPDTSVSVATI